MADQDNDGVQDTLQAVGATATVEEIKTRAILEHYPNAEAAQATLRLIQAAGHVADGYALYHAISSANPEDRPIVAYNQAAEWTISYLLGRGGTSAAAFMGVTGSRALIVGAAAGGIAGLMLHAANFDYYEGITSDFEVQNPSQPSGGRLTTTYTTHAGTTYQQVVDLDAQEVIYRSAGVQIGRLKLDANNNLQELEFTRSGSTLRLNVETGGYLLESSSGVDVGNIHDSSMSSAAEARLQQMVDAFDGAMLQNDPNFGSIEDRIPDSTAPHSSWSLVQQGDRHTYTDGDFRYTFSATTDNFELHYNNVHATYDASGVQTITFIDTDTGIHYFLQAEPDGTKYFGYSGQKGYFRFEHAGELPDHALSKFETFETKATLALGDKLQQFFDLFPAESAHTPSAIANLLNDPTATLTPTIPGHQNASPGQEDSAQNGVTYEISEERSIIIDGQTFYLQQFSGRVDVDTLSTARLVQYVRGDYAGYQVTQNDDVRFRAMAELYQRWTDDPTSLTNAGFAFVPATNGGAMSEVLTDGQNAYGAMTLITKGAYKILTVETIGIEGVPDSVQIATEDTTTGTGSRSESIKINYPDNFNFTYLGGFFGGLLADRLDDGNVFKSVMYKTLLSTAGETMGTYLDVLTASNGHAAAAWAATDGVDAGILQDIPALKARLAANFTAALAGVIGNAISDTLTDAVDIGGIGGEIVEVALDTVTVGVINEVLNLSFRGLEGGAYTQLFNAGFRFDAPITINGQFQYKPDGTQVTVGEHIETQVLNAIAAYAGARLAGEVISPESQQAALFGSIGSGLATAIATGAIKAGAAMQQLVTLGTIGLGPVGIAVAAFVGTVVGTFLGNALFGEQDDPAAWSKIVYDAELNAYVIDSTWSMDHGSPVIASQMAQSVVDGLNAIIEASGGTLRQGSHAPEIMIGYEGSEFRATLGGGQIHTFSTAADAVLQAAFGTMKQFDLVGGYAVLMRAWHNSDAETIHEWKEDLEIASAFQAYLADPTGIVALMLDKPESAGAQAWAAILNRAAELGLHLPHARDLDGGWSEVLRARGDIDPELIPEIDGGDIILIDPVTGEEIRAEHVIGPGYEIVRIPGTDGNDIIQVIVNGPSITYVDGGAGDDVINGTEQADILIGGAGDDTVFGHGGNDWLHGGQGDDDLDGGAGDDLVVGGPNNDVMIGGSQSDKMYGSDGDDVIQGGAGQDFIYGGNGNDTLNGNDDLYDELYGQNGNDTLYGEGGDRLFGGLGDDTYYAVSGGNVVTISRGTGHDIVWGGLPSGGSGLNTLVFDKTISLNELWFQVSGNDLIIKVLGEDQSITVKKLITNNSSGYRWNIISETLNAYEEGGSQYYHDFQGFFAQEAQINQSFSLTGTNIISDANIATRDQTDYVNTTHNTWSKRFTAGWQTNTEGFITYGHVGSWPNFNQELNANYSAGNDLGGAAGSWLQSENLFGAYGADDILISGGDDTIYASAGNDHIVDAVTWNEIATDNRHISDDHIYADSGDDYVDAGFGHDLVVGGLGNDTIYGRDGDDEIYGGAGNDVLIAGGGPIMLSDSNIVHGGQGSDSVQGGAGNDQLYGDEGDDTIRDDYTTGNNIMHGGAGNDQLLATGAGANTLYGEDGNDLLDSFTGQDSLSGGAGNDVLNSGAGNDMLFGDDGDDQLEGEDGDDKLSGGEGNDILDGGEGEDTIFGGAGDDIFVHAFADSGPSDADHYDAGDGTNDKLRVYLTTVEAALPHVLADLLRFKTTMTENQALGTATVAFWMAALGLMASNFETVDVYIDGALQNIAYNQINGTSGADTLSGTSSHDYVLANAGSDTLTGGAGDDYLRGGEGNDIIDAGAGFNFVKSDAGDDQITGGEEQDRLEGGSGNDIITANGGDDHVEGQDGQDQLSGGNGADTLIGGLGDDTLTGGDGNDTLSGQGDHDTITGNAGNDVIDGGSGNDALQGGDGDDKLTGGEGHDTLRGGLGLNELTGGTGADTFTWGQGDVDGLIDVINDFKIVQGDTLNFHGLLDLDLGELISSFVRLTENGDDTDLAIDADGTDNGVNFTTIGKLKNTNDLDTVAELFADGRITVTRDNTAPVAQDDDFAGTQNQTITGNLLANNGHGVDSDPESDAINVTTGTFATAQGGSVVISSGGGFIYTPPATFTGTDTFTYTLTDALGASDQAVATLEVQPASTVITGTSGNDVLNGTNGANTIYGLAGSDQINGLGGNDTIYGDVGQEQISGGDGNDLIYGGDNADTIHGDAGNDTIFGEVSTDTIYGGDGDDIIDAGDNNDVIYGGEGNDTLNGGAGNDTVNYSLDSNGVAINLTTGTATDGWSDTDTLSNIEHATGSAFADTLMGTTSSNTLLGGAGNDIIAGNGGTDTLSGEDGDDVLSGGTGADNFNGGNGIDTVDYSGAANALTINLTTGTGTGQGTDTLANIENIIGSVGNDTLTGSALDNVIAGGAGNDTINGGDGNDTADYRTAAAAVTVNLVSGTATGHGTDTLTAMEHIFGSAYADTLTGSAAVNIIHGGAGNDAINAGAGLDTVYGGEGADTIYGGDNSDTIYGDDGNDIIHAEAGNDIIYGGAGNDTITTGDNNDTIYGGAGTDSIDGGASNDTVSYAYDPSGVIASLLSNTATDGWGNADTYTNIERLTGSGFADTLTGNSSSNIIAGGAGNDTITGNGGTDTLSGEDGDDVLTGGTGADTFDGGNGIDTVDYSASANSVNINLTTGAGSGQGTDTLANIENIIGSSKNDTLRGNTSANTLAGRGGADTMYGEAGADVFLFEAATAYGWTDTLADFSTAQGDKIDISDLLSDYDPLTELIEDFVRITTSGSNSILSVDANGGANSFVQIASITGVTGLTDEQALVNAGNLMVA